MYTKKQIKEITIKKIAKNLYLLNKEAKQSEGIRQSQLYSLKSEVIELMKKRGFAKLQGYHKVGEYKKYNSYMGYTQTSPLHSNYYTIVDENSEEWGFHVRSGRAVGNYLGDLRGEFTQEKTRITGNADIMFLSSLVGGDYLTNEQFKKWEEKEKIKMENYRIKEEKRLEKARENCLKKKEAKKIKEEKECNKVLQRLADLFKNEKDIKEMKIQYYKYRSEYNLVTSYSTDYMQYDKLATYFIRQGIQYMSIESIDELKKKIKEGLKIVDKRKNIIERKENLLHQIEQQRKKGYMMRIWNAIDMSIDNLLRNEARSCTIIEKALTMPKELVLTALDKAYRGYGREGRIQKNIATAYELHINQKIQK